MWQLLINSSRCTRSLLRLNRSFRATPQCTTKVMKVIGTLQDQRLKRTEAERDRSGSSVRFRCICCPTLHACFSFVCNCFLPLLAGVTCRTQDYHVSETTHAFFHPAVMPQYHVCRWYEMPTEGLVFPAQACEADRIMTMYVWARYGKSRQHRRQWPLAHDQSCPCDQEFGWMKNRPLSSWCLRLLSSPTTCWSAVSPSGSSATQRWRETLEGQHHAHFQSSYDVFLCVSRGLGVRHERMSPACVCLFHDFDGWCDVSGTNFQAPDVCADFRQSDGGGACHQRGGPLDRSPEHERGRETEEKQHELCGHWSEFLRHGHPQFRLFLSQHLRGPVLCKRLTFLRNVGCEV